MTREEALGPRARTARCNREQRPALPAGWSGRQPGAESRRGVGTRTCSLLALSAPRTSTTPVLLPLAVVSLSVSCGSGHFRTPDSARLGLARRVYCTYHSCRALVRARGRCGQSRPCCVGVYIACRVSRDTSVCWLLRGSGIELYVRDAGDSPEASPEHLEIRDRKSVV